jgi:tetratricopeptide (TPR) repeat protein
VQGQRYTEEEVNIQKLFLEANREKLLRKYDNAAYLFEEVTKKAKDNPAPYYELAKVYDLLEKSDKALKNIKTAIKLDGSNPWYRIFLAQLYEKNDSDLEAAKVYEQLAKNNPKQESYYYQWAYFLVKAEKGNEAILVFDNLEKMTGVSVEIAERKQKIYHQLGKKKAAAKELLKLSTTFPDNLDYKHNLARYYEQIGMRKKAKEVYQNIVQLNPEDAKARIALASYDAGNQTNDLGYLETLKELFRDDKVLLDVKVSKFYPYIQSISKEKDPTVRQAILDLGKLLSETHSTAAKAYALYGDLFYQIDDLENALVQYKKALKEDDTVFSIWLNTMEIYHQLGKFDELSDFSEEAIDLFPNRGAAYYFSGLASNHQQKHNEAIASYQMALMISGKDVLLATDIYTAMSLSYAKQKQFDKAKTAAENGLKLNPNAANLLEQYGDVLFQKGEANAAIKQWKKALSLVKNSPSLERKIANKTL